MPTALAANPGTGTEGRVAFANGEATWSERFACVELLQQVMKQAGHSVLLQEKWLKHPLSGFLLLPQIVNIQPLEGRDVRTVTTIQIHHPELVPEGLFEYQHSVGNGVCDSILKGFDQWAQMDLVSLLESAGCRPSTCSMIKLELPTKDHRPPLRRRILLGPVGHYAQLPPAVEEEHPFCMCCLFTRTAEAFRHMVESQSYFAIRYFVAKTEEGNAQADCRVNGEDCEEGKRALIQYAETWPPAGYEFRKQYVIIQNELDAAPARD